MARWFSKRPCGFCRKWFRPDGRVGDRQYACSDPGCQRERHRCNCRDHRRRNLEWDREERLRERLLIVDREAAQEDPTGHLDREVARDEIGWQATVIIEEYAKTVYRAMRDERLSQLLGSKGKKGQHPPSGSRDEIASGGRPP